MSDKHHEREVSSQEGQALANDLGCEFVETSAKNGINVEKAFYDVVRQLRRQRQSPMKQLDRKGATYGPSSGMWNTYGSGHQRIYQEYNKKRRTKCVIL
jgi:GTPase KRas protein